MRLLQASGLLVVASATVFACVGDDPVPATGPSSSDAQAGPDTSAPPAASDAAPGADSAPPPSDAGSDGAPARRCNPTADFGAPRLVAGLEGPLVAAGARQWLDATLTDDEALLYFSACNSDSNVDATCDIWQASMSAGVATSVRKVDALSSSGIFERHPTLSPDGKRVFLLRGTRIHTAQRTDPLAAFPAPVPVDSLDIPSGSGQFDTDPFFGRSGKLYFMRGTNAVRTVHYATVGATGIDGARQLAADLTGLDPVMADALGNAESLLFLAKLEGGRRVTYTSERTGATWSALGPKLVAAINDAATSNFVNWVSPDGCRLYFSRGTAIAGPYRIYVSVRPM